MGTLLKIENTSKYFSKKRGIENINLEINTGQIIGLLGSNGSGKSTLLNCIAGLQHINSGDILINGMSIRKTEVKNNLSYMPIINIFFSKWTVKEAISNFRDLFSDFDIEKNERLLTSMNIDRNVEFHTMSSGTLAKIKLIFTLSRKVNLYLLDEPFANIDLETRVEIYKLILEEFDMSSSLILSTHFINEVEMLFDHVILMKEGKIIGNVNVEEYREKEDKSITEYYKEVMGKWGK